ncbi:unnamed protein product [Orchesella dallaii]|uniref:EDRF1 N-terminal domain-containing protein n=1 Tax=Orchesella dallaii TaxID=48710 RepID=A0ABP1PR66_9HEXA
MRKNKSNKPAKAHQNRKEFSGNHNQQPHPYHHHAQNQQQYYGTNNNVTNVTKHSRPCHNPSSGSTNPFRNTKINVHGYTTVTDSDVNCFKSTYLYDINNKAGKYGHGHKQNVSSAKKAEWDLKAQQLSTLASANPALRSLEDGFNLEEIPSNWCCYSKVWNARNYAHELSSNFSSTKICNEEKHVGTADFISDWKNIKALLKSHLTSGHLSYFLHRVGNSVTVDHLDLTSVILFPGFCDLPPEFIDFIKKVIGINEKKIKGDGKSNDEVLSKEAFHKLLYFSMNEPMKLHVNKGKSKVHPETESNFLNRHLISTGKMNLLVGSDVPIFDDSESSESTTIRAKGMKSASDKSNIKSDEAYDLWLDNALTQCPKTRISYHKDWKILKTEWVKTTDLPQIGKFDLAENFEVGGKLLESIKEKVKMGSSYWLYRAPGSNEIMLYNISNIRLENEDKTVIPIFENWKSLETPYYTSTLLMKYAQTVADAVTGQLPYALSFELESPLKKNDKKHNDMKKKVATWFSAIQKQMVVNEGSLIRSLDDISVPTFDRIVMCFKKIYGTAIELTPNMESCLFSHAVEKILASCLKILRSISPKVTSVAIKEQPAFWDCTSANRKLMSDYMYGMCDILTCLSEWHSRVKNWPMEVVQQQEWMYLGCKICVMTADLYFGLSLRYLKLPRCPPLDQDLPTKNLDSAIEYYKKALEQMPEGESFLVKPWFVAPSDPNIISKAELLDEINWKLSSAYLQQVKYNVNHPPIGSRSVPMFYQNGNDEIGREALILKHSVFLGSLLNLCLEYAEKVIPGKITGAEINERTTLIKTSLKKLAQEDTSSMEQHKQRDMLDVIASRKLTQMKEIAFGIARNENSNNAFETGISTFTIQREFKNAKEAEHARSCNKSYLAKVGAFDDNGKHVSEKEGLELTVQMERLTLGSETDTKP